MSVESRGAFRSVIREIRFKYMMISSVKLIRAIREIRVRENSRGHASVKSVQSVV